MRLEPWLVQQGPMSWAQWHWSEGQGSGDKGVLGKIEDRRKRDDRG